MNEQQPTLKADVEYAILVGDRMNMRTIKKQLKDRGYNITETLSKLRAIIVKFTPEQLENLDELNDILVEDRPTEVKRTGAKNLQ